MKLNKYLGYVRAKTRTTASKKLKGGFQGVEVEVSNNFIPFIKEPVRKLIFVKILSRMYIMEKRDKLTLVCLECSGVFLIKDGNNLDGQKVVNLLLKLLELIC